MTKAQAAFIATLAPAAQQAQKEFGIPASITIAQAILESGWGKTRLAADYNNFFGIKQVDGEDSAYVAFATHEYIRGAYEVVNAKFAWYRTPADCFRAHSWLLGRKRYTPAMAALPSLTECTKRLGPEDAKENPKGCGYSTNPKYGEVLMS